MKRMILVIAILSATAALYADNTREPRLAGAPALSPSATVDSVRFLWFTDGPDKPAIEALVAKFNQANPDIKVELSIVPYAELNQLLTTQAAAGQAPDLARVSEPYRFQQYTVDIRPYLAKKSFPTEFLPGPMAMVTGPNGEIYGIPHDLTVNGPFINVSLFKKAGVAVPTSNKLTWNDWMKLAQQVRDKTGVPYAAGVDRSGHRLDGFIQSYGGSYFTADGKGLRISSPETRQAINDFVQMHKDGVMPLDFWAGGTNYVAANQPFVNGQLVFYLSGNWQVAAFQKTIGDTFEWKAMPNAYIKQFGGMPGGKFLIAFKNTKVPAKTCRLLEYLGGAPAMTEYASAAMFLPTRKDLISSGITYPVRNDDMNTFVKALGDLPPRHSRTITTSRSGPWPTRFETG